MNSPKTGSHLQHRRSGTMADFERAIGHTLKWEGGFVDHPSDPGGATNRGITFGIFQMYAQSLLGVTPALENLKALTVDQAKIIYRHAFWNPLLADRIRSQDVANIFFDAVVNMGGPEGKGNGIKVMQRTLTAMGYVVSIDGVMGAATLSLVNSANPLNLYNNYKAARIDYYESLAKRKPEMAVFLKGWLNRINSFVDLIEKKNSGSVA